MLHNEYVFCAHKDMMFKLREKFAKCLELHIISLKERKKSFRHVTFYMII